MHNVVKLLLQFVRREWKLPFACVGAFDLARILASGHVGRRGRRCVRTVSQESTARLARDEADVGCLASAGLASAGAPIERGWHSRLEPAQQGDL